jgi:hypothetical protein
VETFTTSTSRPQCERTIDAALVNSYARIALSELRARRVADEEILERYAVPHAYADATFEAGQLADFGCVCAPAFAVKAEMRRLLAH